MAGRARLSYRTAGLCLSHLIPAAPFRQLLADSPPVAAWFNEGLATKGRPSSGSRRGAAADLMVLRVGAADRAPPECVALSIIILPVSHPLPAASMDCLPLEHGAYKLQLL